MRWLMAAVVAALTSFVVNAAEPVAIEAPAADVAVVAEHAVTVTPVPMPVPVTELRVATARVAEVRPARQAKAPTTKSIAKSLLSRTQRHQVALLSSKTVAGATVVHTLVNDDDDEYDSENLDLHRSFSRPKLVKVGDQDDDDLFAITDAVKLRLYLARMKAVEAHVLARAADDPAAGDDDLPDTVTQRLLLARTMAVQAHRKKFS